jgi:hypothetical protein
LWFLLVFCVMEIKRIKRVSLLAETCQTLGFLLVCVGLAAVSPSLALIVGGGTLFLAGGFELRGGKRGAL